MANKTKHIIQKIKIAIAVCILTCSIPVPAKADETINTNIEANMNHIYVDDDGIDIFLKTLNLILSDKEIKPENVSKLFLNDKEYSNRVLVDTSDMRIIVSDLNESEGKYKISVFWANSNQDKSDTDKDIFQYIFKTFYTDLTEDEIAEQWAEAINLSSHILEDNGSIIFIGKEEENSENIFYKWMKFWGNVV